MDYVGKEIEAYEREIAELRAECETLEAACERYQSEIITLQSKLAKIEVAASEPERLPGLEEMVRINQETGQYDDVRPNPLVRPAFAIMDQEEAT